MSSKKETKSPETNAQNPETNQAGGETQAQPKEDIRLRQNAPIKCCPYHKDVKLVSNRSETYFTRYYCTHPGCNYSEKVPKPQLQQILKREEENEGFSAR